MRLLCIGDNVVDLYPDLGRMYAGGNAVNVAIHARRAGAQSAYWGVVGQDQAGLVIKEALAAEGVETNHLTTAPGTTAHAVIELTEGDRRFTDSDDGVSAFSLDENDLATLTAYDIAHTAYTGSLVGSLDMMAARVRLSFDFGSKLDAYYIGEALGHLALASFSAAQATDSGCRLLIERALSGGAETVLVTRGRNAAMFHDGNHLYNQPVSPVEPVDTLGAGDAFIARVLVGLGRSESPERFLPAAAANAAAVCLTFGGSGHGAPLDDLIEQTSVGGSTGEGAARADQHMRRQA